REITVRSKIIRLIGYLYFKLYAMKVNKHLRFVLFWGLLFSVGCGPAERSDKKVFYYNESDGIATLDPAFAKNRSIMWPIHQLYNTLVETDKDLHFVPCLAKTWEVSADRKTWLFHLRTDVFFQDNVAFPGGRGRRMTAADIVYSFSRI